ncbi:MAG: CaiB/BaiF CoA-transferase family protein [Pseudomonadota bacterium]
MPQATGKKAPPRLRPLKGVRILSLALNLPGPAALMRCKAMGASCVKLEPPAPTGAATGVTGDPMSQYAPAAYADMHRGIRTIAADLKTPAGQTALHRELAKTDILITSFRPSAIEKLGLGWKQLHKRYPALSQIAIVGSPGARAEEPGHDLTYLAENDLVTGLDLPATLYADMGGSLMTSEAALQATLSQRATGKGVLVEIALSDAARYVALPRHWGLTSPEGFVGGAHAGYGVYACKDGRVAVAALEPHFAKRLCEAAGIGETGARTMSAPATKALIAQWLSGKTRKALDALAQEKDIPLHTLAR